MALTDFTNRANTTLLATEVQEIRDHLQGAAASTEAWHFRCSTGNNFLITLADAAGARKFSVRDSAGVEVFSVDSDGTLTITSLTASTSIILPSSASPSQTAEGSIVWDSDDDRITVGDGASRKTFYPGEFVWEHIDTQTLSGTAASVSFASISSAYTRFRLTGYMENDANAKAVIVRLNNDSGGNYDYETISNATAAAATGQTSLAMNPGSNMAASESGALMLYFFKPVAAQEAIVTGHFGYLTSATAMTIVNFMGKWENTADLINRIDILAVANNFAANTQFTLEGAKVTT